MKALLLLLTMTAGGFAGELAVLSTGFRWHADRHEMDGSCVRLYQKDGGYSQLDVSLVTGFEQEVELPAPAAAPAPQAKPVVVDPTPRELVEAAAKKHGLPPKFVHIVVAAESGDRSKCGSPKSASGHNAPMPCTSQ